MKRRLTVGNVGTALAEYSEAAGVPDQHFNIAERYRQSL